MNDRRRINGPSSRTSRPIFTPSIDAPGSTTPARIRKPTQPRKIFLHTGLVPSASGSAYLELDSSSSDVSRLGRRFSSLKISCTVYGPKSLPRNAPFSPQLILTTSVKFAPFASRYRRGFIRDSVERDLGAHLEAALRSIIIGDRWPKSGAEVVITILEGEDDETSQSSESGVVEGWGSLNVLAGCLTAASAALVEAGIDCIDLVAGGCAALVSNAKNEDPNWVVDPNFAEHSHVHAACVVGHLGSRDELVEVWMRGETSQVDEEKLLDQATAASRSSRTVLAEVLREMVIAKATSQGKAGVDIAQKVQVSG